IPLGRSSASGASDSPWRGSRVWKTNLGAGAPPAFPPSVVVQVKALACELPYRLGLPLSRLSLSEIQREVITQGIVGEISGSTLWRWLSADALRPWRHRSWIFPRDPQFAEKAGRILDLYERRWNGGPLRASEFVLCADEKTSIQARCRKHSSLAPSPARPMRVEHEYHRADGPTALSLCPSRLLDYGQRFGSPRPEGRRPTPLPVAFGGAGA